MLQMMMVYVLAPLLFVGMTLAGCECIRFNWLMMLFAAVACPIATLTVALIMKQFGLLSSGINFEVIRKLKDVAWGYIILAGLEDVLFITPILFMPSLPLAIFVTCINAYIFIQLHSDSYGLTASIPKGVYVIVAAFFAMKYGLLTVMVAHSLIDTILFGILKLSLIVAEKKGMTVDAIIDIFKKADFNNFKSLTN